MLDRRTVTPSDSVNYEYDGSYEGFLSCVFESFSRREIPHSIYPEGEEQLSLFEAKYIETDLEKARRVARSIPDKIGKYADRMLKTVFLSHAENKERMMLLFLYLGYRYGAKVMRMLQDDTVNAMFNTMKFVRNEAHLLREFIRFSQYEDILIAQITPKNFVLPLLAAHFQARYPNDKFVIVDKTHQAALLADGSSVQIRQIVDFSMPMPDEDERKYRRLWKLLYQTIEVKERHNEKCRMSHMPKRYWENLTEFSDPDV